MPTAPPLGTRTLAPALALGCVLSFASFLPPARAPAQPAGPAPAAPPEGYRLGAADSLALVFQPHGEIRGLLFRGDPLPSPPTPGGFYISEATEPSGNLLANGSLETDGDGNGVPDGFDSEADWRRDPSDAHSGTWSMRCAIPGSQDRTSGSFGVTVPVTGGGTYLVSFWMKAKGRGGGHPVSIGYVQQQDEAGRRTTDAVQEFLRGGVRGDADWTLVSGLFRTEAATQRLRIFTDIYQGTGALWVDHFCVQPIGGAWRHLPTSAAWSGDSLLVAGEDRDLGFRVSGAWRRGRVPGTYVLRARVNELTHRPRCATVAYRVPVGLRGGRWWRDLDAFEPIGPQGSHARTAPFAFFGPYSMQPWSAVTLPGGSVGLSLGVPMVPPRPFRLVAGAQDGLSAEFDFAFLPQCARFPSSADFSLVLYSQDPAWGFRSAAERYYRIFPASFEVRSPRQGNWYNCDIGKIPRPEDFGLAFNELLSPGSAARDHDHQSLAFKYTEPWGWWGWALGEHPPSGPAPPVEAAAERVRLLAADPAAVARDVPFDPTLVARTILHSGTYDRDGKLQVMGYEPAYGGYNWAVSPAPGAAPPGQPSRFQATYDWEITPGMALGADGIYLDSITEAWSALGNYRLEQLAAAEHPLTFDRAHPRPAQLGVWNEVEFVRRLASDLRARGKLLMANITTPNWVFFAPELDVLGHESWQPDLPDAYRIERALAGQKPCCRLVQLKPEAPPEEREAWMRQALVYGIFPNVAGGTTDPAVYEKCRPLFQRYVPVLTALAEAGWEPVPHARFEGPAGSDVHLERFGPKSGILYITLWNQGPVPVRGALRVDLTSLSLPAAREALRLPEGTSLPLLGTNGVALAMEAGESLALRILCER